MLWVLPGAPPPSGSIRLRSNVLSHAKWRDQSLGSKRRDRMEHTERANERRINIVVDCVGRSNGKSFGLRLGRRATISSPTA